MKELFTIIYYTSNREDEIFENKIRKNLLSVCGDIPIISVSQKPINFGKNICVGDVGACDFNLFRQIQIGCEAATTPFVISAEADCLYPPDYFQYDAKNIDESKYYRFDNLYILYQWMHDNEEEFYKKDTGPFAQIAGRKLYISMIQKALQGHPEWSDPANPIKKFPIFLQRDWQTLNIKNPIVNLKTYNGMRRYTKTIGPPVASIPYWGDADGLRKEIWG